MSQEKIEIVDLPQEVLHQILSYKKNGSDEKLLSTIAATHSIFGHNPFQFDRIMTKLKQSIVEGKMERVATLRQVRPDLVPEIKSLLTPIVFTLAGFAEQDKMEAILKACPELLFTYARLKDISGVCPVINDPEIEESARGITLFQHAVWAGDMRHMCTMILKCLPKNEEGERIRIELLRQYKELISKGVAYEVNGVKREEKQFSLQELIDALRDYDKKYAKMSPTERQLHWCTVVGIAQNRLPAIIRHHYCDPKEAFWKTPTFTKAKLTRSLQVYNHLESKMQSWDEVLPGLGSAFGITWAIRRSGDGGRGGAAGRACALPDDLQSIEYLCKVRTKIDRPALLKLLKTPIQRPDDNPKSCCVIS